MTIAYLIIGIVIAELVNLHDRKHGLQRMKIPVWIVFWIAWPLVIFVAVWNHIRRKLR